MRAGREPRPQALVGFVRYLHVNGPPAGPGPAKPAQKSDMEDTLMKTRKIAATTLALAALLGAACSSDPALDEGSPSAASPGETSRSLPRQSVVWNWAWPDTNAAYQASKAARAGEAVIVAQPEQRDPVADVVACSIASRLRNDAALRQECGYSD